MMFFSTLLSIVKCAEKSENIWSGTILKAAVTCNFLKVWMPKDYFYCINTCMKNIFLNLVLWSSAFNIKAPLD